jgi:hypothetical protein
MGLFNTSKKEDKSIVADKELCKAVKHIKSDVKTQIRLAEPAEESKSTCCGCLDFFKDVKIPKAYLNVIEWLGSLATKNSVPPSVITTALILSLDFLSRDITGNKIAAQALQLVIEQIINQFELKVDVTPDENEYAELQAYCATNKIAIPDNLQVILDEYLMQNAPVTVEI